LKQHIFLILTQPSWDGYLLLFSPKNSFRGTSADKFFAVVNNRPANIHLPKEFEKIISLYVTGTQLSSLKKYEKKNYISKFLSFIAGVIDITDKH
jgi:hypothetical protein